MTVQQLMDRLEDFPPDALVMFYDVENGEITVDCLKLQEMVLAKCGETGTPWWFEYPIQDKAHAYTELRRAQVVMLS